MKEATNHTQLDFKRFDRSHFETYKKWFEYEAIRNALYEIDEEWLNHVLQDDKSIEYAVVNAEGLVGVVGVTFPDKDHQQYVITNIAVNPLHSGKRLGSQILEVLKTLHPLKEKQKWVAYVEQNNLSAQRFFVRNQWENVGLEDDMICYEYSN